ncbi:MAG: hypothetical protein AAF919_04075 [Pseudomonadota bacterium]
MLIRVPAAMLVTACLLGCVPAGAPDRGSNAISPSCRGELSQSALTAIRIANRSADGPNDRIAPQC